MIGIYFRGTGNSWYVMEILQICMKKVDKIMAKLIILIGNSGSGKTSVSKALQKRFGRNTMVISQDLVRREMLWVKDGIGTKALPLLINLLEYGRENSEITIL